MGFGTLRRPQPEKHGCRRFTSPATFRLQVFSTSCRFASSRTFRPCFMPVASMGFFPSGRFPPAEPSVPSGSGPLRVVGFEHGPFELPPRSPDRQPRLQGFALCENSPLVQRGEPQAEPLPSWVFRPLGNSPTHRPAAETAVPLSGFVDHLTDLACARPAS
jgi:hypothetical protein